MTQPYYKHLAFFCLFVIILLAITFPLVFNLQTTVYGPMYGTDNRAAIWHFWWFRYSHEHHLSVDVNTMAGYPYGVSSMAPKVFPLPMLPAFLLSVIFNEVVAYNILLLSSFILSYAFMYILSFSLTRNGFAAFIAGLIFSLCPYHINKSWEHFGLTFIEFIPLYFYLLLRLKRSPNLTNVIFCSVGLTLSILSDLTYSFITFVFSVIYFIFVLIYNAKRKIPKEQSVDFVKHFLLMGIFACLVCVPVILFSLRTSIDPGQILHKSSLVPIRPFHYLFSQSASILAYIVPSKYNPLLGGIARLLEGSIFFGRGSIEQTLYLGWFGLFLSAVALRQRRFFVLDTIDKNSFVVLLCVTIFIFAIIFSMPPYWNLLFFKIYFPSFFIYKILPAFRAYARFGVLAIMAVSVLSAYGINFLLQNQKRRKVVAFCFVFLALLDFNTVPPLRTTRIDSAPPVYEWLSKQNGPFAIIEYPLRIGDTSEGGVDLDYVFFQRFHEKTMFEGARSGTKAYALKESLVNLDSPETIRSLQHLKIKYVIIHVDEYAHNNNVLGYNEEGAKTLDFSHLKGLSLVMRFEKVDVYEVLSL